MKNVKIKKALYIILLSILGLIFVASLVFGSIAAFSEQTRLELETWYATTFEDNISLLKSSIIWLLVSAISLTITLSFKDFKKKFID